MIHLRAGRVAAICLALGASAMFAGDLSSYRGIYFGADPAVAAKQAGANASEVRTTHSRPAVIQEMDWQPRPAAHPEAVKTDPVKDGVLSFFNGQLFRIVANYDRYAVEGMSADDMIDGISASYGPATRPAAEIPYHSIYGEAATVLARWEDPQYSYNLVRTGDRASFALILYSKRLDQQAQAAIAEAVRLDAQEAPQRAIEQQEKRDQDEHLVLEKARSVNKLNFRP